MAKLALVPTPIGNLEDITLRAIRYLKEADIIFAEDTRVTQKLLKHLGIQQKVISFHAHNEHRFLEKSVQIVVESELAVLVSDAGTPAISDPGFLLVRACLQKNIPIECLPGPSALIPAIVGSGFPCDKFIFEGFLPHKKGRQTRLKILAQEARTMVLYESPHRLIKTLEQMLDFFEPERQVVVARELTKHFETYHRGNVQEQLAYFKANPPKGEIVLLIKGLDD
jgi:16S rRNA (cytidine1402-2'-O)-methyltransferase